MSEPPTIAVVGAGAWGAALANVVVRAGRHALLVGRDAARMAAIDRTRSAPKLPGARLEDGVRATADFGELRGATAVLLVAPTQEARTAARAMRDALAAGAPVVACAKGIERGTDAFVHEILAVELPGRPIAALSGPSFADDVARGLPTAVALACPDLALAKLLASDLSSRNFRVYPTDDLVGVEIGGAAKNVLAIAAGVARGLSLGASAEAALVARGFSELSRFGRASGARIETLAGLSGLGDLVLTCGGPQSRNFAFGLALGRGASPDEAGASVGLVEGRSTARALVERARRAGIDLPIAEAVDRLIEGSLDPKAAVASLLERPVRNA